MAAIPSEGTGLLYGDTDPPSTEFGEVINITPPGLMIEAIPTHHLKSTFKTKRAGRIPDSNDVSLRVYHDPNDIDQEALRDLIADPDNNLKWYKIVFVDGNTSPGFVKFQGIVKEFTPDNAEDETNHEADLVIAVASLPTWEPGY